MVKRWNHSQRVIASVGFGLLLFVIARAVGAWAIAHDPDAWFNYAPNNGMIFGEVGTNWWEALTWVAAVGLWTSFSLALFRPNARSADRPDATDPATNR